MLYCGVDVVFGVGVEKVSIYLLSFLLSSLDDFICLWISFDG